jgi:hypothetical protein
MNSTQVVMFCCDWYGLPSAITIEVRSRGSSADSCAPVASPRALSARAVASSTSRNQLPSATPASTSALT